MAVVSCCLIGGVLRGKFLDDSDVLRESRVCEMSLPRISLGVLSVHSISGHWEATILGYTPTRTTIHHGPIYQGVRDGSTVDELGSRNRTLDRPGYSHPPHPPHSVTATAQTSLHQCIWHLHTIAPQRRHEEARTRYPERAGKFQGSTAEHLADESRESSGGCCVSASTVRLYIS